MWLADDTYSAVLKAPASNQPVDECRVTATGDLGPGRSRYILVTSKELISPLKTIILIIPNDASSQGLQLFIISCRTLSHLSVCGLTGTCSFPHSPEFTQMEQVQLCGFITQLSMVILNKPSWFLGEWWTIQAALGRILEISRLKISLHGVDDQNIGLAALHVAMYLFQLASGDPHNLATAE